MKWKKYVCSKSFLQKLKKLHQTFLLQLREFCALLYAKKFSQTDQRAPIKSRHRFSVGLRSGLWLGHSSTQVGFDLFIHCIPAPSSALLPCCRLNLRPKIKYFASSSWFFFHYYSAFSPICLPTNSKLLHY